MFHIHKVHVEGQDLFFLDTCIVLKELSYTWNWNFTFKNICKIIHVF
jgi:hypothetical protein